MAKAKEQAQATEKINVSMKKTVIPIGFTALRDPATGEHLPAVEMFIEATPENEKQAAEISRGFTQLLAHRMKEYLDGCKEAGVAI